MLVQVHIEKEFLSKWFSAAMQRFSWCSLKSFLLWPWSNQYMLWSRGAVCMVWNMIVGVQETRQHDWLLKLRGCLHEWRKIPASGRSLKAEQLYVGFTCRNFSMWLSTREGINDGWATITNMQFFSRTVAIISSWWCQIKWLTFIAVVTQALNNQLPVWFVPSIRIFLVKAVYMVLGSSCLSARKILVLGTSTNLCM